MDNPIQNTQSVIAAISEERDRLRIKLAYAESTLCELVRHNKEQGSMLSEAHALLVMNGMDATLKAAKASSTSKPSQSDFDWIGGTWLVNVGKKTILGHAEAAWQSGKSQKALELRTKLLRSNMSPTELIDLHLLFSAVLLNSNQLEKALKHADIAIRNAKQHDMADAIGKSQFYRGLCFYHGSRYANASWCFVLASHTAGFKEKVEENWQASERERMRLPPNHPERFQSAIL